MAATVAEPTTAIEDLRVGDRVAGAYSADELTGQTQVDPATWRKLRLRAESLWEDGTLDVTNVVTLQPPEWVAGHDAHVGRIVPLPLDLLEMGLPADLRAVVVANEPCPTIADGPGRVVLTTVDHLNNDVHELSVATPSGETESLRPTGLHKFYRATDAQWVSAHDLSPGDRLQGADGPQFVRTIQQLPGTHRVYNLTIEGEHVYRVSNLGVLVHNTCGPGNFADELGVSAQAARRHLRRNVSGSGGQAHHIIPFESRTHDLVQRAARGGFNINGANNGIRLGAAQHFGSHPRYNAAVTKKLDPILFTT